MGGARRSRWIFGIGSGALLGVLVGSVASEIFVRRVIFAAGMDGLLVYYALFLVSPTCTMGLVLGAILRRGLNRPTVSALRLTPHGREIMCTAVAGTTWVWGALAATLQLALIPSFRLWVAGGEVAGPSLSTVLVSPLTMLALGGTDAPGKSLLICLLFSHEIIMRATQFLSGGLKVLAIAAFLIPSRRPLFAAVGVSVAAWCLAEVMYSWQDDPISRQYYFHPFGWRYISDDFSLGLAICVQMSMELITWTLIADSSYRRLMRWMALKLGPE